MEKFDIHCSLRTKCKLNVNWNGKIAKIGDQSVRDYRRNYYIVLLVIVMYIMLNIQQTRGNGKKE